MNNLRQVTLDAKGNDVVLILNIENSRVLKIKGQDHALTSAQQKIICKLAINANQPVSYLELYNSYSDNYIEAPNSSDVHLTVSKLKNTLPKYIKDAIVSERKFGYKLIVKNFISCGDTIEATYKISEIPPSIDTDQLLYDLVGDYYGFYLNPLGTGSTLGAYLHIDSSLNAYAILNLRSDDVLRSDNVSDIFRSEHQNYYDRFLEFQRNLDENNKRCFFSKGSISCDGPLISIDLSVQKDAESKWKILIDSTNYSSSTREHLSENDNYRGGLGLVLASRTINGTMCFRIGLVRKAFRNDFFHLENSEIQARLQILDDSKNAVWRPLKISGFLDKIWYNWIMVG